MSAHLRKNPWYCEASRFVFCFAFFLLCWCDHLKFRFTFFLFCGGCHMCRWRLLSLWIFWLSLFGGRSLCWLKYCYQIRTINWRVTFDYFDYCGWSINNWLDIFRATHMFKNLVPIPPIQSYRFNIPFMLFIRPFNFWSNRFFRYTWTRNPFLRRLLLQ